MLTDAGYEKDASQISVTVNFPDGEKMQITGEDAGVLLYAEDAAKAAYDYGKNGSFLNNELNYIKSLFSVQDIDNSASAQVDTDYIRSVIDDFASNFNDKIMETAYQINEDSITVTKGSSGALADADELYDLVITSINQSVEQNTPITVDYSIGTGGGSDIDLQSIYDTIYAEPVAALYDTATNQVTESVRGVSFDVSAAQKAIDAAQTGATIKIPLILKEPAVTTEQLQNLIFRDILSEKATFVAGTSNRVHNVKLAAEAMNGTILNPGDVFSYNETLGERTPEKGYREAGAYVGGKVVQEVGGGICQGSSTLYFCVLYADLEVVDRSRHMFTVSYLPLGHDATVNWGTVDFKFKNDTDYPIKIEAIIKDGYLNVKLHGTKTTDNTVEVKYTVISKTEYKTIKKEDPSVAPGKTITDSDGHTGYVVDTFKYIYDADGNLLSKTFIARDKYRTQDKVILVPVGTLTSPSPSPSQSPSASPSASGSASPSPSPSGSPTGTPSPSPSPSDVSPSSSPSASASPSESASPSPSTTPSPADSTL